MGDSESFRESIMRGVAEWAVEEDARRRANPQSVLDVAPAGYVVPWSEISARLSERGVTGDVVSLRCQFQPIYDAAAARHNRRKGARCTDGMAHSYHESRTRGADTNRIRRRWRCVKCGWQTARRPKRVTT